MTARKLLTLGVAAVVVIAVALWVANRTPASHSEALGALLYPGLREEVNSVDAVRIHAAGDARAVELRRADEGWQIAHPEDRAGYPADEAKIRRLLLALTQARLIEEKTSNPENYAALGVEDVSAADAGGVRVELGGTSTAFDLIVGKRGPGAKSTYVRRVNEPASWLIDAALEADARPQNWLARDIVDLTADRVQSAEIAAGKTPYTAAKASRADADFKIEKLPRGKQLRSPSAANGLATALANLTLNDVRPAAELENEKPQARATFRTFDGLVAQLKGWEQDGKRLLAISATFDEAQAQRFHLPTAAPESNAEERDAAESESSSDNGAAGSAASGVPASAQDDAPHSPEKVRAEVAALNARAGAWVFEIPQYKYDAIFKPLEDMLED